MFSTKRLYVPAPFADVASPSTLGAQSGSARAMALLSAAVTWRDNTMTAFVN
jgi:hypothetical protein